MFPMPLSLEDGRPDGTVSDDTSNSSDHESERSYQSLQRTAIISCQQTFTKTLSTKLTVMSICSTYGQDKTPR